MAGSWAITLNEMVKEQLADYLLRTTGKSVGGDTDIFATGMVNSLFALQLVTFIEENFKISIENEDLDLKNFSTLEAMEAFVTRKQVAV